MVSIKLAKAKPSQNTAVKFAYLLYDLILDKSIWSTIHLGYFHSIKKITHVLSLWLSRKLTIIHLR